MSEAVGHWADDASLRASRRGSSPTRARCRPPGRGGRAIRSGSASSCGWRSTAPSSSRAAASSTTSRSASRPGAPSNEDASNAVLVCHALTGDSHAAGPAGDGHPRPGWWDDLIGPGKPLDTERWFVVCVNVLGGCQGSAGPASPLPDRPGHYGPDFPVVSDPRHGPHAGPRWPTPWASPGGMR